LRLQILSRTIPGALPFDVLSGPRAKHAMHYFASHKRLPLDQLRYAGNVRRLNDSCPAILGNWIPAVPAGMTRFPFSHELARQRKSFSSTTL
jgi:hypothetical protein